MSSSILTSEQCMCCGATAAQSTSRLALDQVCACIWSGFGVVGAVLCVASEKKLGQSQPLEQCGSLALPSAQSVKY